MKKDTTITELGEAPEKDAADFDKAMDAAGFGLFNLILLLVTIPATCGSMFESTTMSYILPVAECDLQLTLKLKGILNATAYAGMIVSAIGWGYLADTKGRRKILVYGYIVDALCVFCSAFSQNFIMLVIFKFLGGLVVNGPGAVLFTYLIELHGAKYRPRVTMVVGMITSAATTFLPLLAWGIFPRPWHFVLFNVIKVHTWQIFLFVCGLPSLLCGVLLIFLPESPKFLMSQGRNEEALNVFRLIYTINTRKPSDTYPIKTLIAEVTHTSKAAQNQDKHAKHSITESLRAGLQQMTPLLRKPLLARSLQCYTMQFCILQGLNTIRLWLPQLFASIAEYEAVYADVPDSSTNMCTILEYSVNRTASNIANQDAAACSEPPNISIDMYTNNIVVSFSGLLGYFFAGFIVRAIGSKLLLTLSLLISACLGIALYLSSNGLNTLIVSSLFVTIGSVATSSLLNVVTALFPTHFRTLVVSTVMMCGRLGALTGNVLFPIFIEIGCIPPFALVGLVMLVASALSVILPNPDKMTFT